MWMFTPNSGCRLRTLTSGRIAVPLCVLATLAAGGNSPDPARADSVNSPNITMNVDTNRSTGPGAGNVSVAVNTITLAETMVSEYSAGVGRSVTLQARPGFQFDPGSNVTIQSATFGFNGAAINAAAILTPAGIADELLTFNLTSGGTAGQDIIRINGIRLMIRSAAGAAGPAQATLSLSTSAAGGAFTDQGIVAATLAIGGPDHLVFSLEPGSNPAGAELLPAVKMVDFGENLVKTDARIISLAIQTNPGLATLQGTTSRATADGVATWTADDGLAITAASTGYTLRATHDGAAFLSSDSVDSEPFDIAAGAASHLAFALQPVDTAAGADILVAVTALDAFDNPVVGVPVNVTLDSANNPSAWPLLTDTSLTKATVNGVATWDANDHLRINTKVTAYRLSASGVGTPVQSDAFDITAAAPSALRFVQQPTDTVEDVVLDPPVSVEIVDAFGNRTESVSAVNLILQSACGGHLKGATTSAVAGLATFAALKVDTPCDRVVLEGASGNLIRTDSNPFAVVASAPTPPGTQQRGLCGQGIAVALLPMLLAQFGLCFWARRNRRCQPKSV
jgi:hypothetical protein